MQFQATRRSASTILSREAIRAGMVPAITPMMALMPTPTTAFVPLTANTGANPPLIPSFSPSTMNQASRAPITPPTIEINSPSPAMKKKIQ